MTRALVRALLCGIAGLVAWLLTEPFAPRFIPKDPSQNVGGGQSWLILLIGALVGVTAGVIQGLANGSKRQAVESGALGLIFGAIGSTFGAGIGGLLSSLIMGVSSSEITYMSVPGRIVARALAITPIGLFMGIGVGATLRSRRGVIAGLLGGAIGGLATGLAFDAIGEVLENFMATTAGVQPPPGMLQEVGGPSRAVLAAGLGALVGLFCALVDQATRQAWIRLVLGRNEGKEWPIDNTQTTIGRDERANVPLFGDMHVAPLHAIIHHQGARYVLQDQGTHIGVGYNGQRVGEIELSPGDTFQVGSHTLQFLMKDSAARRVQEGRARAVMTSSAQAFSHHVQQPGGGQVGVSHDPYPGPGGKSMGDPLGVAHGTQSVPNAGIPVGPVAPHAMRTLLVVNGPIAGHRFAIDAIKEAGRESTDISLAFDPQASRHHAVFTPRDGSLWVQDLGSTNGTIVNGQRVSTAIVKLGDTVQIGNTVFRVE